MRGGFFALVGFLTLVMGFGALRCFAGLLGSGMVQSKIILLEYRSGESRGGCTRSSETVPGRLGTGCTSRLVPYPRRAVPSDSR